MKEIDRQGQIYTSEEHQYIDKLNEMHKEAKTLAATVVQECQKLSQEWDYNMFKQMAGAVKHLQEIVEELNKEGLASASGWRAPGHVLASFVAHSGHIPWLNSASVWSLKYNSSCSQ